MISYENQNARTRNISGSLLYLLIGGGIGATVALLFAPKPGRELRQDVADGAKYGWETANEKVSQFKKVAGEKVAQLREVADDYYHKAQDKVAAFYNEGRKTISDGTQEAKELAGQVAGQAQDTIREATKPEPPIFESGENPFDQRNPKTGIL